MQRRKMIKSSLAIAAAGSLLYSNGWAFDEKKIMKRAIPSTGELLPVVGVGTWQTFDVGNSEAERNPLREVLKKLVDMGASVVDSSPMYGRSEAVAGELAGELGLTDKLFMATKVWTTGERKGIEQMEHSIQLMGKRPFDLIQIHNLVDWKTHLKTLRKWKEEGKVRYIGITHYTDSAYAEMAAIMKSEVLDFIQIDYSISNTSSDKVILPLAKDRGMAVLINRPYDGGSLFRSVRGKELPPWAREIDCSTWGQFFLKYILGHEAVTCVIPGTDNPTHMMDNLGAGLGRIPDAAEREKMKRFFDE